MELSADSQAMLLICSRVGLNPESEVKPLTLRQWNPLARRIRESSLQRPGALLTLSSDTLGSQLDLSDAEAGRLAVLLSRGGGLAIALERMASLGIWVLTRADTTYPARLKQRLQHRSPAVLFGAGERQLLGQPGLAVVGSRNVDEAGRECADFVGNACGVDGLVLYSGGARGVDRIATQAALQVRGTAVGVLAQGLEREMRDPDLRSKLLEGDLALVTPYLPSAGFSIGAAMGRNKLIYGLADYALVIASDAGKGGAWAGATEALKARWLPVFALDGPDVPDGNRQLIGKGALPLPAAALTPDLNLREWLNSHIVGEDPLPTEDPKPNLVQGRLL